MVVGVGMTGGILPSCASAWLAPTRDAAIKGLSNFVTETVFNSLGAWIDLGGPNP